MQSLSPKDYGLTSKVKLIQSDDHIGIIIDRKSRIIMKDGFIEQIGSPIEVFNNPVNVFVATFIGSPPMNIIECEVIKSKDEVMIKLDNDIMVNFDSE